MLPLLEEIEQCRVCEKMLPAGCRPIVAFSPAARLMIIGQAPGSKVHASGIPWDDASGQRLREWLGLEKAQFYDPTLVGIVPMGFCYPGRGKSGDLPPRPECAPLWHDRIWAHCSEVKLTLLIGQYAQKHYLGAQRQRNLTETVRNFQEYLPTHFPLPHPSPRNAIWLRKNPWFGEQLLPHLKKAVRSALGQ